MKILSEGRKVPLWQQRSRASVFQHSGRASSADWENFTLYSAMMGPHLGYCDVGTTEEAPGRARRAKPKTLGLGCVF